VKPSERKERALDGIEAKLRNYDRAPFMDLLAEWMHCFPEPDSLKLFADKYPDRYIQAMAHLARIAGYTDKTESSVNVNVNVRQLSDSQLEDRLKELSANLGVRREPPLELTAIPIATADENES
jgi:hypothetical protein